MLENTYIQTLDGSTLVQWWEKEDFFDRVSAVITAKKATVIPIPDGKILCDFCNLLITGFPVPVVWGSHALCKECFEGIKKEGGDKDGSV